MRVAASTPGHESSGRPSFNTQPWSRRGPGSSARRCWARGHGCDPGDGDWFARGSRGQRSPATARRRDGAVRERPGSHFRLGPGFAGAPRAFIRAEFLQPAPRRRAGLLAKASRSRARHVAVKRIADTVAALVALLLLSPVLALVGVLIKLTSPGPVFFVHRREGKGGKEFPCIKFRSMVAGAHLRQRELYQQNNVDGPQFKLDLDPRETRLGRWLRRTNVDELPQLLNVVAGHMSLVGPRPSPFRENQICVPWRQARLSVRPGVTGLWQLCRNRRSEGDFHQWIFYDLAYVRNLSWRLDVKILVHTVLTLGGRRRVPLSRLVPSEQDRE